MKILVLGGTGAIGGHLVQFFSNNGIEVIVTSRARRNSGKTVRYLQGNAHDLEFLQSVLQERWSAIIDFMTYTTAEFEKRVNLLLNATSQYIFLSSSRVYADSESLITEMSSRLLDVTQDETFLLTDEYSLAKARQENTLKNSGKINWTIIRPYITYSEKRMQLGVLEKEEWLYRALHGRTIVFCSDINSKETTMTYGLDVAKGIMALIGDSSALGESFHITVPDSVPWSKVLSIYLNVLEKHLGKRPRVLFQDLESFIEHKPSRYQIYYDRLFNRKFDNTKISKHIDVKRFEPVNEGLTRCLERFLQNPEFKKINWKAEGLKNRQTKERASLKEITGLWQKIRYLKFRYF